LIDIFEVFIEFDRVWRGVDRTFGSIRILGFMMAGLTAGGPFCLWPQTKRPPVETEGRLTIACHMKRDNDLVCEHKIKRSIVKHKSLRLSNS